MKGLLKKFFKERLPLAIADCDWKSALTALLFAILTSWFLIKVLLKLKFIPSVPSQLLGCFAYAFDDSVAITNRLFSVSTVMFFGMIVFFGIIILNSFLRPERRPLLNRLCVLSLIPAFFQFAFYPQMQHSWIFISILLFSSVFWLLLWKKTNVNFSDFYILFESLYIPCGFFCLIKAICFHYFPERYVFFATSGRYVFFLPILTFGICLFFLSFPRNTPTSYRKNLFGVVQLLVIPLFAYLLPEVYLREGKSVTLHPTLKSLWCIVIPLMALSVIDIVIRWARPRLMRKVISPFPFLAILLLQTFQHFSVMGLSNFYEYGDRISAYTAIRSGAMTFFKDTALCYGVWDYLILRITEFFSGTLTMADTYGASLVILGTLCISFYILFHFFPVWLVIIFELFIGGWSLLWGGGSSVMLWTAIITIWLYPGLLKRKILWCIQWAVLTAFLFFFKVPHGSMLSVPFLPLFLLQLYLCFRENRKKFFQLLLFLLCWGSLFLIWPFSNYFYGILRIIYETGLINSAWAAQTWNAGSGEMLPRIAGNALLFLPGMTVFAVALFLHYDPLKKRSEKNTFSFGLISVAFCSFFCALSYAFSRIDMPFSRQFSIYICLLPLLWLPTCFIARKNHKLFAFLIFFSLFPTIVFYMSDIRNFPVSPVGFLKKPISIINQEFMADGKDFNLPKAGYGWASAATRQELQAQKELKEVLDHVLAPDETFSNLAIYGGLYFFFDRPLPARHTNYYTVTGDLTQFHMLEQLHEKNVKVTVWSRVIFDYAYPMLHTYYLFRYALIDSFPLKVNDKYFITMPSAYFRKIQRKVPTLAESLKIWDDFYNQPQNEHKFNNLFSSPSVWGRNADKLLKKVTDKEKKISNIVIDPWTVKLSIPQPVSGEDWGILLIESPQECSGGVRWSNECLKDHQITFKIKRGKNIVPLDAYPHWLLAKTNQDVIIFSTDNDLKITQTKIYRRKLPKEILQKMGNCHSGVSK